MIISLRRIVDKLLLQLDQPNLGMPDRAYLLSGFDGKYVPVYYDLQVNVAIMLGAKRAHAQKELLNSLQFEIQLANVSN